MTDRATALDGISDLRRLLADLPAADAVARRRAEERNSMLTKPAGSLGRLEKLASWYASWRRAPAPGITSPQVVIFAGNHGVAGRGVSAFPQEVTGQMVANFESGGAAINQLAGQVGASVEVRAIDLETPTADIAVGAAMSQAEFDDALGIGWDAVDDGADLLIPGEMGIGNSTSAAAVALALYGGSPTDWTGAGTGVEGETLAGKMAVVGQAVEANRPFPPGQGLEVLRRLGGREMAAIAGAIIRARTLRIPVMLDGFICSAAAATLHVEAADALDHVVAGHVSAEAGHRLLLERIGKTPLVSLDLRLGEASGAALAALILKAALACQSGMATFAEASVSNSPGKG